MTRLHDTYGPIVRVGPSEVAFISSQAFRDIYGFRPDRTYKCLPKDPTHYSAPPNGVHYLVGPVSDGVHARHRRLLNFAFSERALRDQERLITHFVDTLIVRLRERIDTEGNKGKVDMRNWFNYTTFDILGSLMFGDPSGFNCVASGEIHPWIALLFNSIKALNFVGVVNQFPALAWALEKCIPAKVKQQGLDHFNLTAEKVDKRLEMGDTERPDFMSAMLKNGLIEKEGEQYQENEKVMSRAEIHSNAFIIIIAGSETSATLLSGLIYYLCSSSSAYLRLTSEIRSAFNSTAEITFASITRLPYLAAVIEESLRVYPPFVTSLARVVPKGGDTVDGVFLPGDTVVACHHYASYHSSSNFARPDDFVPERWLDGDDRPSEFDADNCAALNPFSLGPRGCLGKNLAYAEIRLILSKLLYCFEVELCPESRDWARNQEVYFLWDKPPLMVNIIERKTE